MSDIWRLPKVIDSRQSAIDKNNRKNAAEKGLIYVHVTASKVNVVIFDAILMYIAETLGHPLCPI